MNKNAKLLVTGYRCTGDFVVKTVLGLELYSDLADRLEDFVRSKGALLGSSRLYYYPDFYSSNNPPSIPLSRDDYHQALFSVSALALVNFLSGEVCWLKESQPGNRAAFHYISQIDSRTKIFVYFN